MDDYQAPLADMKFVLRELIDRELLASAARIRRVHAGRGGVGAR